MTSLDLILEEQFKEPKPHSLKNKIYHTGKRALDITIASIGLILSAPVIAVASVGTLIDSGHPIIFSQERRGYKGEKITVYKMRTMFQNTEEKEKEGLIKKQHKFLNTPTDSKVYTKWGKQLEKYWIVELPQFWNVLKGNMSIVGNRPLPDYVIESLGTSKQILKRFESPPGLTGYAQLKGRENLLDEDRIRLENNYSEIYNKQNVFVEDLKIIKNTAVKYARIIFNYESE